MNRSTLSALALSAVVALSIAAGSAPEPTGFAHTLRRNFKFNQGAYYVIEREETIRQEFKPLLPQPIVTRRVYVEDVREWVKRVNGDGSAMVEWTIQRIQYRKSDQKGDYLFDTLTDRPNAETRLMSLITGRSLIREMDRTGPRPPSTQPQASRPTTTQIADMSAATQRSATNAASKPVGRRPHINNPNRRRIRNKTRETPRRVIEPNDADGPRPRRDEHASSQPRENVTGGSSTSTAPVRDDDDLPAADGSDIPASSSSPEDTEAASQASSRASTRRPVRTSRRPNSAPARKTPIRPPDDYDRDQIMLRLALWTTEFLPHDPVAVGASWKIPVIKEASGAGTLTHALECRLKDVRRNGESQIAVIELSGESSLTPIEDETKNQVSLLNTAWSGELLFDIRKGRLASATIRHQHEVRVDFDGGMLGSNEQSMIRIRSLDEPRPAPIVVRNNDPADKQEGHTPRPAPGTPPRGNSSQPAARRDRAERPASRPITRRPDSNPSTQPLPPATRPE